MVEKENMDPSQILALTFSKEAARNMRKKSRSSSGKRSDC
ncbi:MAG: UvrD-helicase domain-containing protein [Candidatus Methanoperedens sp.]|nr:UvrD-helicase domain-containing protein [Candidatus Methanoperedens sp.]MCE8428447.1 UvrD-helicase domain-containing protein [Candidatus Methanoperedens sp.]